MAVAMDKVWKGLSLVIQLQSFPIVCAYISMILLSGIWKKYTSPMSLRPVLIVYNFGCSVTSLYCVYGFVTGVAAVGDSFLKAPSSILTPVFYLYWLTKMVELFDTVFMVLRHRQRQISFLHVYHHSSILILSDLCYHYYPWVGIAPYLGLNSAVHVVLYAYYGLTALNPSSPPPWKKMLTQFQIIQFFLDMVHATFGYLYHGYCIYGIFYGMTMVSLFSNFYYQAYMKPRRSSAKGHDVNGTAAGDKKRQ